MAINIDTVYQRVLTLANKEQRGHINPQQFNLLANQVQLDIFEDYFFKLNGVEFGQKNNSQYNDIKKLTLEKIQPFEKINQPIVVGSYYSNSLPSDVYRLGEVVWAAPDLPQNSTIIPEITTKEYFESNNSPLAKATMTRPTLVRSESGSIIISPFHSSDPAKQVALYFTQNGDTSSDTTASVDLGGNINYIHVGQTVAGTDIPASTTVTAIDVSNGALTLSQAATNTASDVTLTFGGDDLTCNYIRRPSAVTWGYTEINSVALYNSASSIDFELHESEENTLVIKILALAGITIKNPELMQIAQQEESKRK